MDLAIRTNFGPFRAHISQEARGTPTFIGSRLPVSNNCVNKIVDFQAGKLDFKISFNLKSLGQILALKLRPPKPKPKAKKLRLSA